MNKYIPIIFISFGILAAVSIALFMNKLSIPISISITLLLTGIILELIRSQSISNNQPSNLYSCQLTIDGQMICSLDNSCTTDSKNCYTDTNCENKCKVPTTSYYSCTTKGSGCQINNKCTSESDSCFLDKSSCDSKTNCSVPPSSTKYYSCTTQGSGCQINNKCKSESDSCFLDKSSCDSKTNCSVPPSSTKYYSCTTQGSGCQINNKCKSESDSCFLDKSSCDSKTHCSVPPSSTSYYSCIKGSTENDMTCSLDKSGKCKTFDTKNNCFTDSNCNESCSSSGDNSTEQAEYFKSLLNTKVTGLTNDFFRAFKVVSGGSVKWFPSSIYNSSEMVSALNRFLSKDGFTGKKFYIGTSSDDKMFSANLGIINLCMFLAQAGNETLIFDLCDENNWSDEDERGSGKYPLSSACGQGGQDYTSGSYYNKNDPDCCKPDPEMIMFAKTHASWYGAPMKLFCAPKSRTGETTGKWDNNASCPWTSTKEQPFSTEDEILNAVKNNSQTCRYYEGQQGGSPTNPNGTGVSNEINGKPENPKNNVEGCCWWGRGVIQTTGPCNFGKLNKALKASNYLRDNDTLCTNPELICDDTGKYPDLKWISGLYYWTNTVQNYNKNGWSYINELRKFTQMFTGLSDKNTYLKSMSFNPGEFVYAVSGIVNRGCPTPGNGCDPFSLREDRRYCHFKWLLRWAFDIQQTTGRISGVDLVGKIDDCGFPVSKYEFTCPLCKEN